MREVEPASPGHQGLAACGRHCVIDGDGGTALRERFGGHQAGGAGADDGDGPTCSVTSRECRPSSPH